MPSEDLKRLQSLMNDADLDGAFRLVKAWNLKVLQEVALPDRLRLICLISDALDYGGDYPGARKWIDREVGDARSRITQFNNSPPASLEEDAASLLYESSWVILNEGMTIYRHANSVTVELKKAMELFELSKSVLEKLEDRGVKRRSAPARAHYSIGLIHRELYQYEPARAAFARSIEIASIGTAQEQQGTYRYAMSRCYGLGNAYLSYNEASLAEAKCHILAARLLLRDARASYISAYIEMVYAGILLSGSAELKTIDNAIETLLTAYNKLGGDEALKNSNSRCQVGHGPYAIRVANELASAYLRRGKASDMQTERDRYFGLAVDLATAVRVSAHAQSDRRTLCRAHIIVSRVHLAAADDARRRTSDVSFDVETVLRVEQALALASANAAKDVGESLEFSRIDCWITLGEVHYSKGQYRDAIDAFERALEFGKSNRKIFAVCHLHLARTYLKAKHPHRAQQHFATWDDTKRARENVFIQNLSEEIRKELEGLKYFTVPQDIEDLSAKNRLKAYRNWLATTAMARSGDNYTRASGLLKVTEPTLREWLKYTSG